MESEDFISLESMLEVSIVEDEQQTHTVDDKSSKMSSWISANKTLSFAMDTNKTEKPQVMSGENSNATGDKVNQSTLSDVNLMATRVSLEEKVFYKEMFADPSAIESVRLHCTACDRHLGLSAKTVAFSHRILRVLMCQKCYLFYGSGDFSQGEDGSDIFCRWCGQGGKLLCCSLCSNVFCEKCVSRNFGTTELRKIKKADDWYCFVCNLKSLWPARSTCVELRNAIGALKRKAAEVKSKEGKLPFYMDISKCCSSGRPNFKTTNAKESVNGEEQKKPLAMILPLLKKKMVLSPSSIPNVPVTGKPALGYITVPSEQLLRESPSLRGASPSVVPFAPAAPNLHTVVDNVPSPTNKAMFAKTYERIKKSLNTQLCKSATPIGILPSTSLPIQAAQTREISTRDVPRSNLGCQVLQVVKTNKSVPNFSTQPRYVQLPPRAVIPQKQNVGMAPSSRNLTPSLQLPNTRLFAPNQVYTVPASFMDNVCNDARFPQFANQAVRAPGVPPCPPLVSASKEATNYFPVQHRPKRWSNQNEVKTKWFACGVEKFAGVSRVLWSHLYTLQQSFLALEAKNDLQGMKVAAGKLHNLLGVAVEHMKTIDKVIGKDFREWSNSLKAESKQKNVTDPEVIDITDDDHPSLLVDDTPAEVIEVEINPDVVSLGQFSSSVEDVCYLGESSAEDPLKKNDKNNSNTGSRSESITSDIAVTNGQNAVLDHAYSVVESEKAASKPEENDVTLDLDICCESDEENHDADDAGNVAGQDKEIECDDKDVWGFEGYDSDSSLNEKLSAVMKLKQVSFVNGNDCMLLNEVTGDVVPNYECFQRSSKAQPSSLLKASLLKGISTMTQTESSDTFCSMCKDKSISVSNSEQFKTTDLPKNSCSIVVQTEASGDVMGLKKLSTENKCVGVQTESVDESELQKPKKPWSNEFDSFLKNLKQSVDDVPSCTSTPISACRSKDVQKLKTPDDEVVALQRCSIKLTKDRLMEDYPSVAPITPPVSGRQRLKKENLDYIDTHSAVSKLLRSERRNSLIESRISSASNSVTNKRHTKDFIGFEPVAKKMKCEVNVERKYPEILKKMCIVKVERLE